MSSPGPESAPATERRRAVLALTALAFLLRAAFLLLAPACEPAGDEPSWIALGTQELVPLSPLRNDVVFYPPLYPYFIALLWRATGSLQAVLWVQAALGALLVPAVARVGTRAFGRRAGLLAGLFAACYPELVWFATRFWSETLFLVLLWWAIERTLATDVACERTLAADDSGSPRTAATAGLLWALATLTRELALYLVPLVALWLLRPRAASSSGRWLERLRPPRASLLAAATLVLGCLVAIAPWTLRNAIVFRSFIPVSTMGGLNLWQGNTTLGHLKIYEVLAAIDRPVAQDRYCREMAWREIAARQPAWVFEKLASQMPEFWKAGSEVLDHLVGRVACGPLGAAALVPIELVLVVPYLLLLGLLVVGLARLRFGATAWLLLLLLAAYNAAHVVAYATTRLRLPVMPVVFVIAAALLLGRREGALAPLRGFRVALLVVLAIVALLSVAPGLDELVVWRLLTGRG
jgi:4-amino-4-deoxy-L-arabinose transferase-like glycosyltransferase